MWRVRVPTKVQKDLRSVPASDRVRIFAVLSALERSGPYGPSVRHLMGDEYRARSGAYRILFRADRDDEAINVHRVERRTSTTYRKR